MSKDQLTRHTKGTVRFVSVHFVPVKYIRQLYQNHSVVLCSRWNVTGVNVDAFFGFIFSFYTLLKVFTTSESQKFFSSPHL